MQTGLLVNVSIICIIVAFILFIVALKIKQQKRNVKVVVEDAKYLFKMVTLSRYIKKRIADIITQNLYLEGLTEEEFLRRKRRREELEAAVKNCNTGDLSSKVYVREYIKELLIKDYGLSEDNINYAIPFDEPVRMSEREKFESLLHLSSKKFGHDGLAYLFDRFKWNRPRDNEPFYVDEEDIHEAYTEILGGRDMLFEDKVHVVAQFIYSHYLGFGIADEIRDMAIDGISGGVSGPKQRANHFMQNLNAFKNHTKKSLTSLESLWVMYKGESIHLRFLSFESESELRRVIDNIYKYGYPGQLSESKPSIINEMFDGSRVVVVRPKLSESWAFLIRKKYDSKLIPITDMFSQRNNELLIKTMKYLMLGEMNTAITGPQGSGKTTTLTSIIEFIRAKHNLRVQETSFEANLRTFYPNRNILTFQETDSMTGQDGLDLSKKTDGDVSILGEVATDPVAAWAIQTGQVASRFALFTHHAMSTFKLVRSVRNSLLKIGMFQNEQSAEEEVVNFLEFDVHLENRIVERITEVIPIAYKDEGELMLESQAAKSHEEKVDVLVDVMTTYFRQKTQLKMFTEQNILEYRDGAYVPVNAFSEKRQEEIRKKLSPTEKVEFDEFIETYWG